MCERWNDCSAVEALVPERRSALEALLSMTLHNKHRETCTHAKCHLHCHHHRHRHRQWTAATRSSGWRPHSASSPCLLTLLTRARLTLAPRPSFSALPHRGRQNLALYMLLALAAPPWLLTLQPIATAANRHHCWRRTPTRCRPTVWRADREQRCASRRGAGGGKEGCLRAGGAGGAGRPEGKGEHFTGHLLRIFLVQQLFRPARVP